MNILVWGTAEQGPCAYFRGHMYDEEWKKRVRTRILRSDGVLVIVSKNSLSSSGQKWEIQCAKDEGKKVRGIWAYKEDRTNLPGANTMIWSWDNIANWIDSL